MIHHELLAGCVRDPGRPRACGGRPSWLDLQALRRAPRRVDGGQGLHRATAGQRRPGVRARPRGAVGGAGRRDDSQAVGRRAEKTAPSRAREPLRREPARGPALAVKLARNPWFESVAVAQRRAKQRLTKSVYPALMASSEAGVTLADNLAAFSELGVRAPRRGPTGRAGHDRHRDGSDDPAARDDLANRRAVGASWRRARGRTRGSCAGHGDRTEVVRIKSRSTRSSRPIPRCSFRSAGPARASRSRRASHAPALLAPSGCS